MSTPIFQGPTLEPADVPAPLPTTVALNPPMVGEASPFHTVDGQNRDLILAAIREWARGPLLNWAGNWQQSLADFLGTSIDGLNEWLEEAAEYITDHAIQGIPGPPGPNNIPTAQFVSALGAMLARDGHNYTIITGVIRNNGVDGWQVLPVGTNHRPLNVDSVEYIPGSSTGGQIRINYASAGGSMTVLGIAVPDETLAQNGFQMGTSVEPGHMDIRMSQVMPMWSDYVYYDGTNWVSSLGMFENITYSGGVLSLGHRDLPSLATYNISVIPRGRVYDAVVSGQSSPSGPTALVLNVFRRDPYHAYIEYNGTSWVVTGDSGITAAWDDTRKAVIVTHPEIVQASQYNDIVVQARRGSSASLRAEVSGSSSPLTTTTTAVVFIDSAGAVVSAPSANMRFYFSRGASAGGPSGVAGAPDTDMKFFITHGGGHRIVNPSTIDTITYPNSNIWFYIIVGLEGGA